MSEHVALTRLTEMENDRGEIVLRGSLGMAEIIGRRGNPNASGQPTWVLLLTEPDEAATKRRREARKRYRQRKRLEEIEETGGRD